MGYGVAGDGDVGWRVMGWRVMGWWGKWPKTQFKNTQK